MLKGKQQFESFKTYCLQYRELPLPFSDSLDSLLTRTGISNTRQMQRIRNIPDIANNYHHISSLILGVTSEFYSTQY